MPETPEIILRVAYAIEDEMRRDPYMPDVARAAIAAMREPTKPMILAGAEGVKQPLGSPRGNGTPRAVALIYPLEGYAAAAAFRLMIDAALASPEEGRES